MTTETAQSVSKSSAKTRPGNRPSCRTAGRPKLEDVVSVKSDLSESARDQFDSAILRAVRHADDGFWKIAVADLETALHQAKLFQREMRSDAAGIVK
jgi:hypothetical protein